MKKQIENPALRWLPALFFCMFFFSSIAQEQLKFNEFNYQREEIGRRGMLALGSWATLNIAASTPLIFTTKGEWGYFNQMNVYWNLTNLGIAIAGYIGAKKNRTKSLPPFNTFEKQKATERIFMFNLGLDGAYIMTGLFLSELSHRAPKGEDLLKGFGKSMAIQGAFLAVFDLVMYLKHRKHGKQNLPQLFEKLEFSSSGARWKFN